MVEFNVDRIITELNTEAKKTLSGKKTENTLFPVLVGPGVVSFYHMMLDSEAIEIIRDVTPQGAQTEDSRKEDQYDDLKQRFLFDKTRITNEPRKIMLSQRDLRALDILFDVYIENLVASESSRGIMYDNKKQLHVSFKNSERESRYSLGNRLKRGASRLVKKR